MQKKIVQRWEKQGLIFRPNSSLYWQRSHAQVPTVDHKPGERTCTVYYAGRTAEQRSHIGRFEFDLEDLRVVDQGNEPVLAPGDIGFFDQHGVYPSCVINREGRKFLYYIGWNQGLTAPLFYASIGLAISEDEGQSFKRYSPAPIMQRSRFDPCMVTAPNVYRDKDGLWRIMYVSGLKWEEGQSGELISFYHLKIAKSEDGINWVQDGTVGIDFSSVAEKNIARPCVLNEDGIYKVWYSYVNPPNKYRIGYAESNDGINWTRKDEEAGLNVSEEGFDSDMMCYPSILTYKGRKYMFYNGNNFGYDGVGLAIESIA